MSFAAPLAAHHSLLGFDGTRQVTIQGVVSDVVWASPHAYISVDALGGKGRWVIESESPVVLQRLGWTKGSVRVGDRISSAGSPARDGTRLMRCQFVTVSAGPRLPCFPLLSN